MTNFFGSRQMDSLEGWRRNKALPYVKGSLLDLGCGFNNLVRSYGRGVGVDVFQWPGVDVLINNAACLPFADATFDTATILAALNHIPNREHALSEVYRVLRKDGRLIVTMIGPLTGLIAHIFFVRDEKVRGGMRPGEKKGMKREEVISLLAACGFAVVQEQPFQLGLNRVYMAEKHSR